MWMYVNSIDIYLEAFSKQIGSSKIRNIVYFILIVFTINLHTNGRDTAKHSYWPEENYPGL